MRSPTPRTGNDLTVNVAIGYDGREQIARAASVAAQEAGPGGALTPELIARSLLTHGQPDPELVIRTSGQGRLSGLLLWESSHAEIHRNNKHCPEFTPLDLAPWWTRRTSHSGACPVVGCTRTRHLDKAAPGRSRRSSDFSSRLARCWHMPFSPHWETTWDGAGPPAPTTFRRGPAERAGNESRSGLPERSWPSYRFSAPSEIASESIPPALRPLWTAALNARASGAIAYLEL